MVKKSMKTEISDYIYTDSEIEDLKFNGTTMNGINVLDHDHILQFLARVGLIKNNRICDVCLLAMQLTQKSKIVDKYTWKCKRPCRKEISIRKNSIFEDKKASLWTFFNFLIMWSRENLQIDISEDLNINKNTLSLWAREIRELVQFNIIQESRMLGGYDSDGKSIVVEIDESLFFKRKYNRGRYSDAQWVFGLIERGTGKCALFPVADRSAQTLIPIICEVCRPGTTIISDSWASYRTISSYSNFTHLTVNHSLSSLSPENHLVHTQTIENTWLHAKRSIRKQFGCKRDYLEGYLFEFVFKKNVKRHLVINKLILLLRQSF